MTFSIFPNTPLGKLCRVQSGYAFKSVDWLDTGVPVVQIGNVKQRHIVLDGCKFVSETIVSSVARFRLRRNDILVSMTGNIGIVGRVLTDEMPVLNQRVGRFEEINTNIILPNYLFQVLQVDEIREKFIKLGHGAAQPNISPNLIATVEIPLPPLPAQCRIASILGVYDDLIEVNRRRIAVLEEMARGLFEEWFVRFRFPGHESVPIEDTPDGPLPKGWTFDALGKVAAINAASLKPTTAPAEIGYIDIASVSPGQINAINYMPFSEAPGRARRLVRDGSILWSNVRPNRRSFALVLDPAPEIVASTGFTVLDARKTSFTYLYHWVTTENFIGYLVGNAQGAAYPAVIAATFERATVLLPHSDLVSRFTECAEPMLRLSDDLRKSNQYLAAARDLLLPRLISGQLSVTQAECELEDAS